MGPSFPYDPSDLPSLNKIFGSDQLLVKMLKKAGIKHTAEVMVLSGPALMMHGVTPLRAQQITRMLGQFGLCHIEPGDRLVDFLDQQFGCVENAPIEVLNVALVYNDACNARLPEFRPLKLVSLLVASRERELNNSATKKRRTIGELAETSIDDIWAEIDKVVVFGPAAEKYRMEVYQLNNRMVNFRLQLGEAINRGNALDAPPGISHIQ